MTHRLGSNFGKADNRSLQLQSHRRLSAFPARFWAECGQDGAFLEGRNGGGASTRWAALAERTIRHKCLHENTGGAGHRAIGEQTVERN